jgi:ADP-ribosylglycohydrolase
VNEIYGKYYWVHVLPNLAFVLIGLIWGQGDFTKTVATAIMCGSDTDCNGATAGSIIGAMKGKNAVPGTLADPLNDRIKSAVFGYSDTKISSLVEETAELLEITDQP